MIKKIKVTLWDILVSLLLSEKGTLKEKIPERFDFKEMQLLFSGKAYFYVVFPKVCMI